MFVTRVLPIVLLALACSTKTDILQLDPTPRAPTVYSAVQLIGQEPTRPYIVLAIVSASTDEGKGAADELRHRIRKEAARLGGDAVLFEGSSLTRFGSGGEYGGERVHLSGKVIVYADTAAAN